MKIPQQTSKTDNVKFIATIASMLVVFCVLVSIVFSTLYFVAQTDLSIGMPPQFLRGTIALFGVLFLPGILLLISAVTIQRENIKSKQLNTIYAVLAVGIALQSVLVLVLIYNQ